MKKDSLAEIHYKMLKFTEECDRKGIQISFTDLISGSQLGDIPPKRYNQALKELAEKHYVTGVDLLKTKDGDIFILTSSYGITSDGEQYLDNNSSIQKVAGLLGKPFLDSIAAFITELMLRKM